MAKRMAATLRRKSVMAATGPYGVKNECRDWRADQSRTAAWARRRQHRVQGKNGCKGRAYGSDESDEIYLKEGAAREVGHEGFLLFLIARRHLSADGRSKRTWKLRVGSYKSPTPETRPC